MERRVLLVEDDPEIGDLVALHLGDLGCTIDRAADGLAGLDRFRRYDYALVVLDLMLPKLNGIDVCRRMRAANPLTPILMLTAKSEEEDVVAGLGVGADDYVTKPFSIPELLARVKAAFRRAEVHHARNGSSEVQFGSLLVDLGRRRVAFEGHIISLTQKEFDLLALFVREPGRTYTRRELLALVWGSDFDGLDHTLDTHISRLRSKIEPEPSHPRLLKTVWGIGYRFVEPEELAS